MPSGRRVLVTKLYKMHSCSFFIFFKHFSAVTLNAPLFLTPLSFWQTHRVKNGMLLACPELLAYLLKVCYLDKDLAENSFSPARCTQAPHPCLRYDAWNRTWLSCLGAWMVTMITRGMVYSGQLITSLFLSVTERYHNNIPMKRHPWSTWLASRRHS